MKFIRRALAALVGLFILFMAAGMATLATRGPVMTTPAAPAKVAPAEKSIFVMTQAERKAAYLARQEAADDTTPQQRARWACSARLKDAAYVPDSVEWTHRTAWPVVQVAPGVFEVQARFTASNRLGVELAVAKRCRVSVSGAEARVLKVS